MDAMETGETVQAVVLRDRQRVTLICDTRSEEVAFARLAKTCDNHHMIARRKVSCSVLLSLRIAACACGAQTSAEPRFSAELIFPLHHQHNHAPAIVECPN